MKSVQAAQLLLAGIVTATAIAVPAGGSASASTVPFTDQDARGYVGFCNASGQPVTSGSILDDPFVWTAVSSTPAPNGYAKGKATLYVYQPRKDVDPGEWSGEPVTGSSTYTNPNHPMAQATSGDAPLISVDGAYPPEWNGLYQLRMYFTGPSLEAYTQTYPATVIRVSGEKWSVVQGGTVACDSGKATSSEVVSLNKPGLRTPQSVAVSPGTVRGAANTGQGGTTPGHSDSTPGATAAASDNQRGSRNTGSQPGGRTGLSASDPVGTRAARGGGISGGAIAGLVLITLAALAGGSAGLTLWRRRAGGGPVATGQ